MIVGKTRFYVVAGIVGGIVGEALAAMLAFGVTLLAGLLPAIPSRHSALAATLAVLALGLAGGGWAGVALMRWWYRRESARTSAGLR